MSARRLVAALVGSLDAVSPLVELYSPAAIWRRPTAIDGAGPMIAGTIRDLSPIPAELRPHVEENGKIVPDRPSVAIVERLTPHSSPLGMLTRSVLEVTMRSATSPPAALAPQQVWRSAAVRNRVPPEPLWPVRDPQLRVQSLNRRASARRHGSRPRQRHEAIAPPRRREIDMSDVEHIEGSSGPKDNNSHTSGAGYCAPVVALDRYANFL